MTRWRLLHRAATIAVLAAVLAAPLSGCQTAAQIRPTLIRVDSAVYQTTRAVFEAAVLLGDTKVITPQQELKIQEAILPVAKLGEAATLALAAWESGPTPQVLKDLVRALGDLTDVVVRVLVDNDAAQASLLAKIASAQQAVLTIVTLMGGAP